MYVQTTRQENRTDDVITSLLCKRSRRTNEGAEEERERERERERLRERERGERERERERV